MITTRLFAAALAAAAFAAPAASQEPDELAASLTPKPFVYPHEVEVFDLPTAPNGVDYRLYVRAPLVEPEDGERASAIYLLDGQALFTPAASMAGNQEYFGYIPPAYFIGVGYQEDGADRLDESDRTRDYTPTSFTPPEGHFLENSPQDWEGSGGAAAFFAYVEDVIVPFVEARYDVDPDDRVLVGKSTSGLGATYALLEKPGLFNRFVIVSPALWWDDWLAPRHERWVMRAEAATRETAYPAETRVYFAAGEGEHTFGLVTDVLVLFDALKSRRDPNLKVAVEILPGEQHESVFPAAFMRGIIGVYSDRRESSSPIEW